MFYIFLKQLNFLLDSIKIPLRILQVFKCNKHLMKEAKLFDYFELIS